MNPMIEKTEFKKISVRKPAKREFAILAASKGISEADLFEEMLKLYKAAEVGDVKTPKVIEQVSVEKAITQSPINKTTKKKSASTEVAAAPLAA
jgi:hypothetical protein